MVEGLLIQESHLMTSSPGFNSMKKVTETM